MHLLLERPERSPRLWRDVQPPRVVAELPRPHAVLVPDIKSEVEPALVACLLVLLPLLPLLGGGEEDVAATATTLGGRLLSEFGALGVAGRPRETVFRL